jgi:glycosyltransferase involved in cell wall biosynthesis
MKTVCIMDSVSRANGGIFEAERRLQQELHSRSGIDVQVIGLKDSHTEADTKAWLPLVPNTFSVKGPRGFGYSAGLGDALGKTDADLGYLVGLWKYPSVATLQWSRQTGKPVMVAPHGMLDPWALRNSGLKKKIAGWLFQNKQLRRATCLRALCLAEVASIRAYGLKNPVCVIPNGIDPPEEDEHSSRHPLFPAEGKVLLYLGRLHPKKGLANLIAAWNKARATSKGWSLAIAGWDQGGHEAELKRQATELGIAWADGSVIRGENASIRFLGPQFGEDKSACYRSCDAFILPSFSEGHPMVVLEAWAHAKPVLMTPECNLPEGFETLAALRIEPTVESIAHGLTQLFAMPADDLQEMGRRGRGLTESRFAWPKVAEQMASVYQWMLGGGAEPDCVESQ